MIMPIIDLHEDLLIAERAGNSGTGPQTGFEKLAESPVRVVLATGFTDVKDFFDPAANELFEQDINDYVAQCRRDTRFKLITSVADLRDTLSNPVQRGVIFHIEGFNAIRDTQEALTLLENLYAKGLRSIGPLWTLKNAFGGGTHDELSGLTALGAWLIDWCESHNVIFDLAHMNAPTLADALARIQKPPLLSHTACYSLVPSVRTITDEQLRKMGKMDGVVGVFLASKYAASKKSFSSDDIADHVMHMRDVAGEDHVALGTDYGGITSDLPSDLPTPKELPTLFETLRKRGLSETALEKLAFRNAQRVLEAHLE